MKDYDIICLNEIETCLPVTFPGYVSHVSYDKENGNRGGTCVFIRHSLNKYVFDIDMSSADQVWFKLKCVPGVLFGSCYVPPSDSEYFNYAQISNIQEKLKSSENISGTVIVGDMNARLGVAVREQAAGVVRCCYPAIPDPVSTPNDNATAMLGICMEEKLLVVNNLQMADVYFPSKKTFRKGREWVSELDTCIMSVNLIKCVKHFDVIHNDSLPSDHAPVAVAMQLPSLCLDTLAVRAAELGAHSGDCRTTITSGGKRAKPPLQFCEIWTYNHKSLTM